MGSNVGEVRPTPEMIAMADKIMDRYALHNDRERTLVHDAALTAIMEVSKKLWTYEIQYGPEGEADYAHVFDGERLVCVMKIFDAIKVAKPSATGSI